MTDPFEVFDDKRVKDDAIKRISAMPSNYVGSKRRMLSHIWNVLEENEVEFETVFDAFSGSAMVSLLFNAMGKKVACNDLLTSSAITAICLLENDSLPIEAKDIRFLCKNEPSDCGSFVEDNYKDKFFTESECRFLDRYRRNIELLCGDKFYCGIDLINKATLASIPNSNFSVYGKDLKALRSTHKIGRSFWDEKWRDTTRKRRDDNNEIMFDRSLVEVYEKYKGAFSLFAMESHVNQCCFLGGRYYNGQTVANLQHRLEHDKSKGREITDMELSVEAFRNVFSTGDSCVFNADIIELLGSGLVDGDLIYLDPPYGGSSSDYSTLYRFLEEFIYECKLEDMEHIIKGGKRFSKKKGYQAEFENLLALSSGFPVWLLSYNESSYADLDTIESTIRNAGRTDIVVEPAPITYQYRKGKNVLDVDHFKKYAEEIHVNRGTEYLILAR